MNLNIGKSYNHLIIFSLTSLNNLYKIIINVVALIIIFFFMRIIFYQKQKEEITYKNKLYNIKIENNTFKFYYLNCSKDFNDLYNYEKYCSFFTFKNTTFFDSIKSKGRKIKFLIFDIDKQIDNVFILTIIFPFLKKNSTIIYKIKNRKSYKIFKRVYKLEKIQKIYQITRKELFYHIFNNYNKSIYFEWETIYEKNLIDKFRYIINNYYNESILEIFDKSLNLNFKYKINNIKGKLTFEIIDKLMSKFFINIIINRKFRNF